MIKRLENTNPTKWIVLSNTVWNKISPDRILRLP